MCDIYVNKILKYWGSQMMTLKMESYFMFLRGGHKDISFFKMHIQCNGILPKCQQYYLMKPDDSKIHIKMSKPK